MIDANWGSSNNAFAYHMALKYINELSKIHTHVKNYRPQILCLTGDPDSRPILVETAAEITRNTAICFFADIRERG